jgi:hypothetical protein
MVEVEVVMRCGNSKEMWWWCSEAILCVCVRIAIAIDRSARTTLQYLVQESADCLMGVLLLQRYNSACGAINPALRSVMRQCRSSRLIW